MPRNYSIATVKQLFGQASSCAHPECSTPLVFEEHNKRTVIAQIAHIRSESKIGPRHQADYKDVDEFENLLLLCGVHHPPVDQHESVYPVVELLKWKQAQVSSAAGGTKLSEAEAKGFVRLTSEEREAITEIARAAARVVFRCETGRRSMQDVVDSHKEAMHLRAQQESGGGGFDDSEAWRQRFRDALLPHHARIEDALEELYLNVAVLEMMSDVLAAPALQIRAYAQQASEWVGYDDAFARHVEAVAVARAHLWLAAHGN